MTSFCECETCVKMKEIMSFPVCSYCKEKHDPKVCCPEYKKFLDCKSQVKKTYTDKRTPNTIKHLAEIGSTYFLDVANGKYSVYQKRNGSLKALRYGEHWRDLTGDNLVFNLMVELIEAKERIENAKNVIGNIDCTDEYMMEILNGENK